MTTASQVLFVAVSKANAASRKANVVGSFTRTLNAQSQIITFSGSFKVNLSTTNGAGLAPVHLFDTTGTENEDLFLAVLNNLTNPVNPTQTNFRLTGSLSSDGKGNLLFSYSGQLPYTDAESSDGLSTTRTVPAYFVADVPTTGGTTTSTTSGTTTPGTTTTTTKARSLTFLSSTGGSTGSIAAATPIVITGSGLTPGAASFTFFDNGVAFGNPTSVVIASDGSYSFAGFTAASLSAGTWKVTLTDSTGTVTSNNFIVAT